MARFHGNRSTTRCFSKFLILDPSDLQVEKTEYDNCILDSSRLKFSSLLRCTKPTLTHARQYTMLIKSFHAIPGALEFREGKEYYFISK